MTWRGKDLPNKLGLPAVLASSMAMARTCRTGGIGKVIQSQFASVGLVMKWQKSCCLIKSNSWRLQNLGFLIQNLGFLALHSWLMVVMFLLLKYIQIYNDIPKYAMISQKCYDRPKFGRARMRKKAKIFA